MRHPSVLFLVFAFAILAACDALAWNSLGHRVVTEIAWQQLAPERRQEIVDTLKHHPRFAKDFLAKMPRDVADGDRNYGIVGYSGRLVSGPM